jgi:hypothetical protein
MSSSTSTYETARGDAEAKPEAQRGSWSSDVSIYILLTVLVYAAWRFSQLGLFKAGDDVGYWIGVAGGVTMLFLFTYPLRKYVRGMHRLGKVKGWFFVHMVLGVAGPLLILLHSTFHVGSTNAAVAFYSMLIVAGSGVIGRFLYLRVNRGLSGERTNLRQLQARAGLDQTEARSRLHFAPAVEERLQAFHDKELDTQAGLATYLRQVLWLPVQQWFVYRACLRDLRKPLARLARQRSWNSSDYALRKRLARKLVRKYLTSVVRVAQFTAYERVFALWHIAHVPFIYLLVVSAVIHVIAVHAY